MATKLFLIVLGKYYFHGVVDPTLSDMEKAGNQKGISVWVQYGNQGEVRNVWRSPLYKIRRRCTEVRDRNFGGVCV